ncbi:MAG: aromatic amino acid lyase, partial [Anaerolineales bacterium]|nr:aromatic amino acid lyase [Anaerolineales bacterium]
HVSMGATAVRQAEMIMTHTETIVAIELLAAAQGIEFRRKNGVSKLGQGTAVAYKLVRQHAPFIAEDCYMAPLIEAVRELVHDGAIKRNVETAIAADQ